MATLKGQNFRICIFDATAEKYKVIGMSTGCTVTLTNNTDDGSHKDIVGAAAMPTVVSRSWSVSCDSLDVSDAAAMLTATKSIQPVTLMWDETSTSNNQTREKAAFARKGSAYMNDVTFNFNDRENSTKALQFAGSGALETVGSSEAVEIIPLGSYTKGQFVRLFLGSDNITAPSKVDGRYNYSHNVTIENCTFEGNHTVGSASFIGTYNLSMVGCTATNMHSLLQVQSCDNSVDVESVAVVGCKNGVSFGNTAFPTIKNSKIEAEGYGVRVDGDASRGNLVVENLEIDAKLPVIARRVTTPGYVVNFQGSNVLNTDGYQVIFTQGSDSETFVAPEVGFVLNGADGFVVFPRDAQTAGFVYNADELQSALVSSLQTIKLQPGVYEGAFTINRAVEIVGSDATIVGRVSIVNANPTFSGVKFDRNDTDSDAAWDRTYGWSNCLQYKAVVMIYGNQLNKITFQNCEFYNNLGVNKSAITNVACELIVDNCYFEGRSSAIYSQCNLSITNSTFNYTGSNNVIASINGCGDAGGKFIFKNNQSTGDKIFALSQFLSTTGFGNGNYYFDVDSTAEFDYYFLNEGRVTNKSFAEGSVTF